MFANHASAALQVSTELVLCTHQRSQFSSCLARECLDSAWGVVMNANHLLIKPFLGFSGQGAWKEKDLKRNIKKDRRKLRNSSENSQTKRGATVKKNYNSVGFVV